MPLPIPAPAYFSSPRRFASPRRWFRRLVLALALPVAFVAPAFADQSDSHDALVEQLVQEQHASPLVADCAAHAAFVVPTSPAYDHVEFLNTAFDAQHATVEPWNQPFDDRKQRITVDTLVSVNGLGYRKGNGERGQPDLLKFRCGYVADKLLAFGYNEPPSSADAPLAPAPGRHARRGAGARRHTAAASRRPSSSSSARAPRHAATRKTRHGH